MFKEVLKELRMQADMTQEELASKLGIAKSTVSMYENGNREPNFEQLEAIADIFNVDMNRLIGKGKDTDDDPDAPYQLVGHGLTGGERLVDTPKHAKISEIRFYLEQLDEAQLETVLQFVKFTAEQK